MRFMILALMFISSTAWAEDYRTMTGYELKRRVGLVADTYETPQEDAKTALLSGAAALSLIEPKNGTKLWGSDDGKIVHDWLIAEGSKSLWIQLPNGLEFIIVLGPDTLPKLMDQRFMIFEVKEGTPVCDENGVCGQPERCKGPQCKGCNQPEYRVGAHLLDFTPVQYLPLGPINLFQPINRFRTN